MFDFWIMGEFWIMGDFWIIGEFWIMGESFLNYSLKNYKISVTANNLFDAIYSETNLVEMPGRNILVGLNIKF